MDNLANVEYKSILEIVEENVAQYALATFDRAFPFFADGMKPVIRRIIYTMDEDHVYGFKKVASIAGAVMGRYHPHADASINTAIISLGQTFNLNHPLVDGQGNYGSITGDSPASPRYVECKLSNFARDVITQDIDSMSIDYKDNYDYSRKEPAFLPTRIPLVLVEGSSGIGEAFAVDIPPHNLNSVVNMCSKYIKDKNIHLKELIGDLCPDYPTGGEILNADEITKFYTEGIKCTIKVRAKVEVIPDQNTIVIKELPYGVTFNSIKEMVVKKITIDNNLILSGVLNMYENKPKKNEFEIICKKESNPLEILNELFKATNLSTSIPMSFMMNFGSKVRSVTIKDIIENWYKIRVASKRRKMVNDISGWENRKHILEGIYMVYDQLDDVIAMIRKSGDRKETISALHKRFKFSMVQARGIYEMQLGSLSGFSKKELESSITELGNKVIKVENDLMNIDNIILFEIDEIKMKYGRPRRTAIVKVDTMQKSKLLLSSGCLLYSKNSVGIFNNDGLQKGKLILNGMRSIKIEGKSVKEITGYKTIENDISDYIIFRDNGTCTKIDTKTIQMLNAWHDETTESMITSVAPVYTEEDVVICVTKDNKTKKISSSDIQKRYVDSGGIITSSTHESSTKVLFVDTKGDYVYIIAEDIPLLSRSSAGVLIQSNNPIIDVRCIKEEEFDTLAIFMSDTTDDQGYILSKRIADIQIMKRSNRARKFAIFPESFICTGFGVFNSMEKESLLTIIGVNSTSTAKVKNFKKVDDLKRIGVAGIGCQHISM